MDIDRITLSTIAWAEDPATDHATITRLLKAAADLRDLQELQFADAHLYDRLKAAVTRIHTILGRRSRQLPARRRFRGARPGKHDRQLDL